MKQKKTIPQVTAQTKLLDYLARRDHSEKELRRKLSRRYPPEEIAQALSWAHTRGWLKTPDELAEQVARSLERKNKSNRYINQYLREKGLPPLPLQPEREAEKCRRLLVGKLKFPEDSLPSRELLGKMRRLLLQRGFDRETIRKVLHEK